MRTLSNAARTAIYAQQTDKVFLIILDISHADFADTIRIVNDYSDVTSNGNVYTAFPFTVTLPKESEEVTKATLVIDNVSRTLIDEIRTITTPPDVSLNIILSDTPDIVEVGPFNFKLKQVTYDQLTIQGSLDFEDVLFGNFPNETFTPQNHPGMFA